MQIEPFGVEQWMNAWETKCTYNLAETCVASLTVEELLTVSGKTQSMPSDLGRMKLTYGDITGSEKLRQAITSLYSNQTPENVLVTHGTIGANHMVYQTLVSAGDRVVAITPTYQQHTSIPKSIGAEVSEVPLSDGQRWHLDINKLRTAVTENTRLIALTNPNNPTGALLSEEELRDVIAIADSVGAWVLCDEVYRGTEQGVTTPSVADLYDKGISTASTSKAFSLAGLRTGWIVGPKALLEQAEIHRDYTTISVGMINDYFATLALEHKDQILERSRAIVRENLKILSEWAQSEEKVSFTLPQAGTTALLKFAGMVDSYQFCETLIAETGVMFTPGSVMGMEGYVRIGYACETEVLRAGLSRVSDWLKR